MNEIAKLTSSESVADTPEPAISEELGDDQQSGDPPASEPAPQAPVQVDESTPSPKSPPPAASKDPPESTSRDYDASVQFVPSAADWFLWTIIVMALVFVAGYLAWSGDEISRVLSETASTDQALSKAAILNIAASTYVGFMLGGVIALLGCMITLRRINARVGLESRKGPVPGSFTTDSAGLFIVLLGVALIGLSITKPRALDQQIDGGDTTKDVSPKTPDTDTGTPSSPDPSAATPPSNEIPSFIRNPTGKST